LKIISLHYTLKPGIKDFGFVMSPLLMWHGGMY